MDDEFKLEMSPLCQTMRVDNKTIQVDIYRGESERWVLEVIDGFGNSAVWNDEFATEKESLMAVKKTIREEGVDSLIGEPF